MQNTLSCLVCLLTIGRRNSLSHSMTTWDRLITYQYYSKSLLQLRRVRHGDFQWHNMMLHLRLSVHTFNIPHLCKSSLQYPPVTSNKVLDLLSVVFQRAKIIFQQQIQQSITPNRPLLRSEIKSWQCNSFILLSQTVVLPTAVNAFSLTG